MRSLQQKMKEYDQLVDWYVAQRNCAIGVAEIARLAALLPVGATVVDIGCGDGIPISQRLLDYGFKVYGIDSSGEMVKRFQANFPGVAVECSDVLTSDLFGREFDAAVAYGVVFHLSPPNQARLIRKIAHHLRPGGLLLFNSGNEEGEGVSEMAGIRIPQYSLSAAQYEETLRANGMILVQHYLDPQSEGYIYLARKDGGRGDGTLRRSVGGLMRGEV